MTTGWTDFVDPPSDPFDLTKMPGTSPLPIDYDVLNALADPQFGLATTPKASDRAQSAVDGLAGAITYGLTGVVGTVTNLIESLFHTQTASDENSQRVIELSADQQAANQRLDALEDFQGTGIATPLWTSIGGRDIATFPDSMMLQVRYQDSDSKN